MNDNDKVTIKDILDYVPLFRSDLFTSLSRNDFEYFLSYGSGTILSRDKQIEECGGPEMIGAYKGLIESYMKRYDSKSLDEVELMIRSVSEIVKFSFSPYICNAVEKLGEAALELEDDLDFDKYLEVFERAAKYRVALEDANLENAERVIEQRQRLVMNNYLDSGCHFEAYNTRRNGELTPKTKKDILEEMSTKLREAEELYDDVDYEKSEIKELIETIKDFYMHQVANAPVEIDIIQNSNKEISNNPITADVTTQVPDSVPERRFKITFTPNPNYDGTWIDTSKVYNSNDDLTRILELIK